MFKGLKNLNTSHVNVKLGILTNNSTPGIGFKYISC